MTNTRPHFERPPLVEQAIVVTFDAIKNFSLVDYGLFWGILKDEFPIVDAWERDGSALEYLDGDWSPHESVEIEPRVQFPRAMYRNNESGELIQMQDDRFGFNWFKSNECNYPHAEAVMERFNRLYDIFEKFMLERHGEVLKVKQCERTNLNIIRVEEFGNSLSDMRNAFVLDPLDVGVPFLVADTYVRSRQHLILGEDQTKLGRLHTELEPVVSSVTGNHAFRLEITARSFSKDFDKASREHFFNVARNSINAAFCATVTPEMKNRWGMRDD